MIVLYSAYFIFKKRQQECVQNYENSLKTMNLTICVIWIFSHLAFFFSTHSQSQEQAGVTEMLHGSQQDPMPLHPFWQTSVCRVLNHFLLTTSSMEHLKAVTPDTPLESFPQCLIKAFPGVIYFYSFFYYLSGLQRTDYSFPL